MSYLEMSSSTLPDMNKGIISFWFRDTSRQVTDAKAVGDGSTNDYDAKRKGPKIDQFPQGFWGGGPYGNKKTMVPPNVQYLLGYDPEYKNCIFFWNAYGLPLGGLTGEIFGGAFLGPPAVWIPSAPPVALNTMTTRPGHNATEKNARNAMSEYGIRALITFGNPNIPYNYAPWEKVVPDVLDSVYTVPDFTGGPTGASLVASWVPPYAPYLTFDINTGEPIGDNGKFHPRFFKIKKPEFRFKCAPSFIGLDDLGNLVVNLQTNTKATYKGMAFQCEKMTELWAHPTYAVVRDPPTYTQIGWPFADVDWHRREENFFNGYQFEYKDISQDVMGCAPESFVLYAGFAGIFDIAFGPNVRDGGWHHILFSFDISGSVSVEQPSGAAATARTDCKAWIAMDDVNYTGANPQNRPMVHDGYTLPKLLGTETSQVLDCGPTGTFGRASGSPPNQILPRNAWLTGWGGNPKDGGFPQFVSGATIITDQPGELRFNFLGGFFYKDEAARGWGGKVGDFNWIDWTGRIWPLFGHGIAPGPWQATYTPMHPTVPDPKDLAHPSYKCSGFKLPTNGYPIGVPAMGAISKHNCGLEMAELQIWANQSIDTGVAANRRLFIDAPRDADGRATGPMRPVPPKTAATALGTPDILLHGSGNWRRGVNTGSTGRYKNGEPNPAGQFTPIASILKFLPDPKLGQ